MNTQILYKMFLLSALICIGCGQTTSDSRQESNQSSAAQQPVVESSPADPVVEPSPAEPNEPVQPVVPAPEDTADVEPDPAKRLTRAMTGMTSIEELQANQELFKEIEPLLKTNRWKLVRVIKTEKLALVEFNPSFIRGLARGEIEDLL